MVGPPIERRADRAGAFLPLGVATTDSVQQNSVEVHTRHARVVVTALAPDLFRVGMFAGSRSADFRSLAVDRVDWPSPECRIDETETDITLATAGGAAHLSLSPLRIGFRTAAGENIAMDDPDLGMGVCPLESGDPVDGALGFPSRLYKRHAAGDRYFGCGERTGGLEKTDSHQIFWNMDPPAGHGPGHNNLYVSIPFLLALRDGTAWGLFLDNPGLVEFDLAHEDPDRLCLAADTGSLVYYVFTGPSPRSVLERYTELTGRTPMPPVWALGNHQSRYSYMSDGEVRSLAAEFRRRDIPCDVIHLDIDYMDGYRVFTWNHERFPDPRGLTDELRATGFRLITILDPGVKQDEGYEAYQDGRRRDIFCKTSDGQEYHNVVWPGMCAFPDFLSARGRGWWAEWMQHIFDQGVGGVWCDMDEPAVFVPLVTTLPGTVVHEGEDRPVFHAEIHNLYGSLTAQAARDGFRRHRPNERPVVISRAGYAGLQRHALHWTGDNNSWWVHLAMALPQLANLGLSGVAWAGVDVGGFGEDSSGELLTRWTEFGIFQPFFRNHSAKGTRRQEPWAFGEPFESIIRQMLQLRQRLIPYLYSLFDECNRTGAPLLRPLLFEFPDDPDALARDDELMCGDALLIAPIVQAGTEHRHVYLPAGTWFHFWSGECHVGPCHLLVHAPLGRPAVFVRAGYAVPLWPVMAHTGERAPDPLTLVLYAATGSQGALTLYEDAGNGYDYERGEYARRTITCVSDGGGVAVRFHEQEGTFQPDRGGLVLEMRAVPRPGGTVTVNGEERAAAWVGNTVTVNLEWTPASVDVVVSAPTE